MSGMQVAIMLMCAFVAGGVLVHIGAFWLF
jgi:hypothetical protein